MLRASDSSMPIYHLISQFEVWSIVTKKLHYIRTLITKHFVYSVSLVYFILPTLPTHFRTKDFMLEITHALECKIHKFSTAPFCIYGLHL
jgi:hypothetical protein